MPVAYSRSWKLSLAITSIVPCIAIAGAFMNIFMSKYKLASLGHIAEGGSVAEEVIGTIRTAQAFGSQNMLSKMYNTHITRSAQLEKKMAIVNGLGLSVFFFVIYSRWVSISKVLHGFTHFCRSIVTAWRSLSVRPCSSEVKLMSALLSTSSCPS